MSIRAENVFKRSKKLCTVWTESFSTGLACENDGVISGEVLHSTLSTQARSAIQLPRIPQQQTCPAVGDSFLSGVETQRQYGTERPFVEPLIPSSRCRWQDFAKTVAEAYE